MAAFLLPTFNLLADQWISPNKPSLGAANRFNIQVQLYIDARNPGAQFDPFIRMSNVAVATVAFNDVFECPQGSGRYYKAQKCEVVHCGFPNEYWSILTVRCDAFATSQPGNLPS